MESLIQYVWKHKLFPVSTLRTTCGQPVEVLHPGFSNPHAGPDFLQARVRIGDTTWAGAVEVHCRSSDWKRHRHSSDPAYRAVILHVVEKADCEIFIGEKGQKLLQLELSVPEHIRRNHQALLEADRRPRCQPVLDRLTSLDMRGWFTTLQVLRLERKATRILDWLHDTVWHWEDVLLMNLARNFGFGVNGDAFDLWARKLPFEGIDKHRDDPVQVEALLFGTAGLLEKEPEADDAYYRLLQKEYRFLRHKFRCQPMQVVHWKFLRLRPVNFPHLRIAQLAVLCRQRRGLLSRVLETESLAEVKTLFDVQPSSYWDTHYTFGKESPRRTKRLGSRSLDLLVINTVVPFLYTYGMQTGEEHLCDRAQYFLESLPVEDNRVVRSWKEVGVEVRDAAASQAILELQQTYCDRDSCLSCRFGYEFIRRDDPWDTSSSGI
ncbi:MAG: DUF2851 family protein [Bacteroides sp.]|nr:DUF2851 family protein [Bacteroides sp.]